MKKYTSVFGLFARSSIYKILLIIAAMATVQTSLFLTAFNKQMTAYESGVGLPALEQVLDYSDFYLIFIVGFVAISVLLCLTGTSFSSKTGYTLDRLSVSERAVFFCQAIYNLLVFIILWTAELALCFGLSIYFIKNAPAEAVSNQTIFLAFYRDSFLHTLLPLSEVLLWIRNIFLLIALTIATAEYPYKQRRKKLGLSAMAMIIFTVVFFKAGAIADTFNSFLVIVVAVINVIEMCYNFFSEDNGYEGEN